LGFSNQQNLVCAAFSGAIYVVGSWSGGRFAQTKGYFTALAVGFAGMLLALLQGARSETGLGQIAMLGIYTAGMSFTWPALEALVSENEARKNLTRMVGLYNLVWAATGALAYFVGGAILEALEPKSSFYVPAVIHLCQLVLLFLIRGPAGEPSEASFPENDEPHPVRTSRLFLRLAWVANPFAYVAINSLVPMIPFIAHKLQLSPMLAGFFCSTWLFARFGAFWLLWVWPGWHYRFGFLLGSYIAMVGCYGTILLSVNLWLLILVQVGFGLATGLIYYSSLYYSMDVGDTKGEHGGLHEAAIGLGNLAGPGLSAAALGCLPNYPQSGTWSVCGLLVVGLTILFNVGRKNGLDENEQ
jgi:MFS family permease